MKNVVCQRRDRQLSAFISQTLFYFILAAANDSLQILDLSWNYIRLKGGISIAKGLKVRTKLNQFFIYCYSGEITWEFYRSQ